MMKDIKTQQVENVAIAIVAELSDAGDKIWNVYIVNYKDTDLETVLVSSSGYGEQEGEEVKTSMLRHLVGDLSAGEFKKIEPIDEAVFSLNNEYWFSFFIGSTMYDKKVIFKANSISEQAADIVPIINKKGVMLS